MSYTEQVNPGIRHFAIAASATAISPRPRALFCHTAGTITVEDELGVALTYPLVAGQVLDFRATKVTALGTAVVYGWI